jgi:phosphoglycerate dehydrogenase-like enzyme
MEPESKIAVLITISLSDELIQRLTALSPRLQITVLPAHHAEDVPPEVWQRTEVLYTSTVLPDPDSVPHLRWVQFHWAGIDFAAADPLLQQPELRITTLSGAGSLQVAEYAVAMMLALAHRLPALSSYQSHQEWPSDRSKELSPQELRDATVGLVGYGSIGREIARILQPFHVTILAAKHDVFHPEDTGYAPAGTGDPEGHLFTRLYPIQALNTMLPDCDFVVVSLPLTSETDHLFGNAALSAMKPGSYLVSVGRGKVVNETALIQALQEGKIGGAAMDVFEEEPLPKDSPLWTLPNVIVTPHVAGFSKRYNERAIELFSENLRRYMEGAPLYNTFDIHRGY